LSDEQEAADADDFVDADEDDDGNGEFFVLDTNRAEIIEEEEITIVGCKGSEQIQLSKAKRSEETFDLTKILTNDPTTASLSVEKKEKYRFFLFK
uniref:RanBD1 domain-containing protein n=1 Tax=Gongylonema pulchrum TaxID=637853 RepID=A0A183ERA2_9BILA